MCRKQKIPRSISHLCSKAWGSWNNHTRFNFKKMPSHSHSQPPTEWRYLYCSQSSKSWSIWKGSESFLKSINRQSGVRVWWWCLTKLNESIQRERYPLPAVEQTLVQLAGAKFFSKLDANSRFWQILLDPASSLLITFITPFGRYCFHHLPFGISSASKPSSISRNWA